LQADLIEAFRVGTVVTLLGASSLQDYRNREVSDNVWLLFVLAAVFVDLLQFDTLYENLSSVLGMWLLQAIVFAGLYWVGAFGGADAKSYLCLSLMYPTVPSFAPLLGLHEAILTVSISSFANSALLSLIYVPLNLMHNALTALGGVPFSDPSDNVSTLKKLTAFGLLRRLKSSEFNGSSHSYQFAGHSLSEVSLRSLVSFDCDSKAAVGSGLGESQPIYVQPLVPLQVFVLAGFIVTLVVGNIMLEVPLALIRWA